MISIDIILAIIGFVAGVMIGMTAVAVAVEGRANYRLLAARHPWMHLVSILWMIACGAVVAFFAYGLAQ